MLNRAVTLEVESIKISGQLYLPGKGDRSPYPAVCICHGIPAHPPVPGDRGYPVLAERVCGEGFAVLIFNFRGTGASGGNLDILGWVRDLKAALDYLWTLPEVDRAHLALMGFSGGAAVSVCRASQDDRVSHVVACACPARFTFFERDEPRAVVEHFRSLGAIRDETFPPSVEEWFSGFQAVSPVDYVAGIAPRSLFLVHGSQDDVVPVAHAHEMYARAGEPKQLAIIDGAGHRLRQDDRAMSVVIDWLKQYVQLN
jgi:dipeptidyl aminopeptidase/acylaminoacyl peptidase